MQESKIFQYVERVGIAVSVLLNVLFGGYSNQTFSARNYSWKREGKPNIVWLIDPIFRFLFSQQNHCMEAWINWKMMKNALTDNAQKHLFTSQIKNPILEEGFIE